MRPGRHQAPRSHRDGGQPPTVTGVDGCAGGWVAVTLLADSQDDLLDAAAVAWSARRIAAGEAVTLTSPAQRGDDGTEIAIRY
jgi:predicted RNase H-like nuclease